MTDSSRYAWPAAAPDLFFVCNSHKFLFLAIAKNASTTMKNLIFELNEGREFRSTDGSTVHDVLGYAPAPERVIDRRDRAQLAAFSDYTRFVVYRDPVERLMSTYNDKATASTVPHRFFQEHGLIGLGLDPFLVAVEDILEQHDPLLIDEHLRPQYLSYSPADVDLIVAIEELNSFLWERFGIRQRDRQNTGSSDRVHPNDSQQRRIRSLYRNDYSIRSNLSHVADRVASAISPPSDRRTGPAPLQQSG